MPTPLVAASSLHSASVPSRVAATWRYRFELIESRLVSFCPSLFLVTIALKSLLQQRHLHEYSEFVVEYEGRARELDLPRHASAPTKAQYYRWVGGHIQNLPRGYHCMVLEKMFPRWTARELFGDIESEHTPTTNEALLSSIASAVEPGGWQACGSAVMCSTAPNIMSTCRPSPSRIVL